MCAERAIKRIGKNERLKHKKRFEGKFVSVYPQTFLCLSGGMPWNSEFTSDVSRRNINLPPDPIHSSFYPHIFPCFKFRKTLCLGMVFNIEFISCFYPTSLSKK